MKIGRDWLSVINWNYEQLWFRSYDVRWCQQNAPSLLHHRTWGSRVVYQVSKRQELVRRPEMYQPYTDGNDQTILASLVQDSIADPKGLTSLSWFLIAWSFFLKLRSMRANYCAGDCAWKGNWRMLNVERDKFCKTTWFDLSPNWKGGLITRFIHKKK